MNEIDLRFVVFHLGNCLFLSMPIAYIPAIVFSAQAKDYSGTENMTGGIAPGFG